MRSSNFCHGLAAAASVLPLFFSSLNAFVVLPSKSLLSSITQQQQVTSAEQRCTHLYMSTSPTIRKSRQLHDFYGILEIPRHAKREDIKNAYRRLVKQYHPDAHSGKYTIDKFQQLQLAYQVLYHPRLKQKYDTFRDYKKGVKTVPELYHTSREDQSGALEWSPFGEMGFDSNGDCKRTRASDRYRFFSNEKNNDDENYISSSGKEVTLPKVDFYYDGNFPPSTAEPQIFVTQVQESRNKQEVDFYFHKVYNSPSLGDDHPSVPKEKHDQEHKTHQTAFTSPFRTQQNEKVVLKPTFQGNPLPQPKRVYNPAYKSKVMQRKEKERQEKRQAQREREQLEMDMSSSRDALEELERVLNLETLKSQSGMFATASEHDETIDPKDIWNLGSSDPPDLRETLEYNNNIAENAVNKKDIWNVGPVSYRDAGKSLQRRVETALHPFARTIASTQIHKREKMEQEIVSPFSEEQEQSSSQMDDSLSSPLFIDQIETEEEHQSEEKESFLNPSSDYLERNNMKEPSNTHPQSVQNHERRQAPLTKDPYGQPPTHWFEDPKGNPFIPHHASHTPTHSYQPPSFPPADKSPSEPHGHSEHHHHSYEQTSPSNYAIPKLNEQMLERATQSPHERKPFEFQAEQPQAEAKPQRPRNFVRRQTGNPNPYEHPFST